MNITLSTTFWIQFLGILFGLAMLYMTFLKMKRKEISGSESLFWFLGWIVLIIIAIIPKALDPVLGPLHFYRRMDFFVVFGFFVLLGLGFYNYSQTRRMERKLETFVRRAALKKAEEEQKSGNKK